MSSPKNMSAMSTIGAVILCFPYKGGFRPLWNGYAATVIYGLIRSSPKAPMSRGLLFLFLQILICIAVAGIGFWTLLRPRRFQAFLHENFGLLPHPGDGVRLTPLLIRLSSIFLLWYAAQLAGAFRAELRWIADIIGHLAG